MGKKLLFFIILLGLAFVVFTKYNHMANLEKGLKEQWNLIESLYGQKSDILLSLSKHISDNTDEENPIFDELIKIRNTAAKINVDTDKLSDEDISEFKEAYRELIATQAELLELARQFPDVYNNQEYRELKTEIEGNEIRIANERRRLNEHIELYNKYVNGFFNLAIAQLFGFHEWPFFAPILGE